MPTAPAPRSPAGAANPATAGVSDGSGGWLAVADAVLPDGSVRLVAQKLDAAGARQWLPNGTAVATSPGSQSDAAVVPDGSGGLIVVWRDHRATAPGIYAQRIGAAGARLWGDDGVAVEVADPSPSIPRAIADAAGGVIVAWHDARLGQYDIYAQRLDAGGTPLWTVDGLRVYSNAFDQRDPAIVPDGEGGAILAWEDQRSGLADLYGQRLGPTGTRRWGSAGLVVCNAAGDQRLPVLALSDTFAVVAWQDTRAGSGTQIYTQRLDRFGIGSWAPGGVAACDLDGSRTEPVIVGDGAGGALLAWAEQRFTPAFVDVYAQHVDLGGAATWTVGGAEVFANVTYREASIGPIPLPAIAPDGAGGLFVAYERWELAGNLFDREMMCQRLDAAGAPVFLLPGATLSGAPFPASSPIAMPDGAGGCVAMWLDSRSTQFDTFAQRIAADGTPQWIADGVPVYLHPGVQVVSKAVADGAGGTIVAWLQKVGENYDVFARRFDASGVPLWPAVPVCTASGVQGDLQVLGDGAGGVFLNWFDTRSGRGQLFVQHLDASGTPSWQADGVLVKETGDYTEGATLILDGAGGVIVPFRQLEQRSAGKYDLWGQHFSADGARTWGDEGVPITLASNDVPWGPRGIPDGAGGAMIVWETWPFSAFNSYLLAQRLDANGQSLWATNGILVASKHQRYDVEPRFAIPEIVSDGGSGAIVAWEDARVGAPDAPDVYAQHLDASGLATWTAGGVAVSTGPGAQCEPQAMADGAGGVIVAWADNRLGTGADLHAQRFGPTGAVQWLGGSRAIAAPAGVQERMAMVGDGGGGFIAAWDDGRAGTGARDIYTQRMDAGGNTVWLAGGVEVCTAPGIQVYPAIAEDGAAGAFVTWADARDGESFLVRLQHIDAAGDTTLPRDGVTDVLASIVRAEAAPDRVTLAWHTSNDGGRLDVERRVGDGPWVVIGSAIAAGTGLVEFEDRDVATPGARGYRLAWGIPGGRVTAGEAWIKLVEPGALAIALPSPHPARGPFALAFTLPRAGVAEIELLDVSGRRLRHRRFESATAGTHRWTVDPSGRLAPGIYLVRLTQGGEAVVRRLCLLR